MSNLPSTKVLRSIDLNIPQSLHQEPILARLISEYDVIVNFNAAVLDRNATGGGWFNLSLEGHPHDVDNAVNYLRSLEIEIFDRTSA
jgi:NIL domain